MSQLERIYTLSKILLGAPDLWWVGPGSISPQSRTKDASVSPKNLCMIFITVWLTNDLIPNDRRYILLLKQIIKYTEPTHPDFHDITTCLDRLRDYLKRLNDSMEHSFQLVTAQITPQPGDHHNDHNEAEKDKKIGFTNALGLGFGFGSRSGKTNNARSSVCSSQSSHSTTGDVDDESNNRGHKVRYRRSTSVPRSQHHHHNHHASYDHSPTPSKEVLSGGGEKGSSNKLKSRSKSDWTVCKACNCNNQVQPHEENKSTCLDRALSDSDINSDTEESPFLRSPSQEDKNGRKFSTSKSLHDFPNQHPDWFLSQPSLCDGQDDEADVEFPNNKSSVGSSHTVVRNNVMIRPLSSAQGGSRYVARIQRGSSESEMNLHMIGGTTTPPSLEQHKKKTSLRTSLKNIFSLKKRYKNLSESTVRNDYRVLYSDKVAKSSVTHTQLSTKTTLTRAISISPLIQYYHRMPSYLELVMFSVRETTVWPAHHLNDHTTPPPPPNSRTQTPPNSMNNMHRIYIII